MNALAARQQQAEPICQPCQISTSAAIGRGLQRAIPVMLGYLPLSFAFGVMALSQGVSVFNTVLMTMLVYGGSSQVAALSMLAQGASSLAIVITVGVINMRHLLMAAVLAPQLSQIRHFWRFLFGFQLTDEVFALHSLVLNTGERLSNAEIFAVNFGLQGSWLLGTLLALFIRADPTIQTAIGLDYAMAAMFIVLLVLIVRDVVQLVAALGAGLLAVFLRKMGLVGWDIMIAAILGATFGLGISLWIKTKSSLLR